MVCDDMKINNQNWTIGADPEIFMAQKGQFVSAHNVIPGDKQNPYKVKGGAVQVDGMALEFNIDPSSSFEEFANNLNQVQNILKDMIGDAEFLNDSSVFFDEKFLESIPFQNRVLGCEMDYDGWSLSDITPPNQNTLMRTVGGHVHLGGFYSDNEYDWKHFQSGARMARILDETLGVYSILWDKDDFRRKMYGKAGCFRPKKYGMEYRTLSNQWLFKPALVRFVYNSVVEAIEKWSDKNYEPNPEVQQIINTSDRNNKFFSNDEKALSLVPKLMGVK